MSDPTAPGDGEDAVGDLLSTAAAPAAPDGRPGGVGRASALRSAEAPRGKMGTPGSNKPMITTVAPWALPGRTGTATGTRRRRVPPSFAAPAPSSTDGKDTRGPNTTGPSESANVIHDASKLFPATNVTRRDERETETMETIASREDPARDDSNAPLPPRSFLDECPGLSDRDAQLEVRFMTYGELFATARKSATRIAVPTFQRTYCWTTMMAVTFFRDVALRQGSSAARVKGGHGTGKCLFRRVRNKKNTPNTKNASSSSSLLCLDGQQRCTTLALCLAAIRDAAETLALAEDENTRRTALEETVRRADSALFLECGDDDDENKKARRRRSIFFPSCADRAAFAACVGACDEGKTKETTETSHHFLVAAKRALDAEAKRLSPSALADALEAALNEASLTYVEVLGPDHRVDLAQAFQWLQEKTLFAASAVLWNATPGLTFAACDLARNYLLASTLRLPVNAQEETHVKQWLEPLESRVVSRRLRGASAGDEQTDEEKDTKTQTPHLSEAFDAFIKAFLDDDDARFAARVATSAARVQKRTRRVCAMERDLRRMLLSEHAPESTKKSAGVDTAVWTYARFRSFAERVASGREDWEEDASTSLNTHREFRVDFTTSAPPPSWEGPAPADTTPADERGLERVCSPEDRGDPPGAPKSTFNDEPPNDDEPPPVLVDDAARREVLRRLVAFGENEGFLK